MLLLDWLIVGVLFVSLLVGAWRGLVYELMSVANWAAAFVLAQWFAGDAARWIAQSNFGATFANEALRFGVAFALVFVGCLFTGGLMVVLARKLIAAIGLRPVDRVLGAAFGIVRGMLIVLVAATLVEMSPLAKSQVWQDSVGVRFAVGVLTALKPVMPEEFGKYLP